MYNTPVDCCWMRAKGPSRTFCVNVNENDHFLDDHFLVAKYLQI